MELENGNRIAVEAQADRMVEITVYDGDGWCGATLTSEEARILANTLLAAMVEAEQQPRRSHPAEPHAKEE